MAVCTRHPRGKGVPFYGTDADDAIEQIHGQQYAAQYKAEGKKIVLIGSSFDENTRTIKDWKTEAKS